MKFNAEEFGASVREYISRAVVPLVNRLVALEVRKPETGPPGERGIQGEKGEQGISGVHGTAGIPGPKGDSGASIKGEAGERGADGKTPEIEPIVATVLQRIPTPRDGRDGQSIKGERGEPGESIKGEKGERGQDPTAESIREVVMAAVGEAVTKLPKPQDGKDGLQGVPGKDGIGTQGPAGQQGPTGIGEKGEPGPQGQPGESIRGERGEKGEAGRGPSQEEIGSAVEREFSKFALDCERRIQELTDRTLQRAIDKFPLPKDGADGKNGRDALDMEDIEMSIDDDGFLNVSMKRGEFKKQWRLYIPTVSDKGTFKADGKYLRQNGVTHKGSFWIAQVDNPSEVPGTGPQWRMAVKAGRDAKDGATGEQGPQGNPGQDLRYK